MATRHCPSCLARATALSLRPSPCLIPIRTAMSEATAIKYKRSNTKSSTPAKKKSSPTFNTPDLRLVRQFSLIDAMRYLRAAEVGYNPSVSKYELHVRLRTLRNGPVIRSRIRLPHPVKTDLRICVIAAPESSAAKAAEAAGANIVGEESIFTAIKEGRIEFEKCICHEDSLAKLGKSGVARILGPRGLMPSAKLGTVMKDVGAGVREMVGASEYRERFGVVRMAVGQLQFSPAMLQDNIRAFVQRIKHDMLGLSDRVSKEVHEVVLSSTHGPGLSLNGDLQSVDGVDAKDVTG
ncbi:ribosomal protein L1, partial [Piedraia hortae CBS 480.64]